MTGGCVQALCVGKTAGDFRQVLSRHPDVLQEG